MHRPPPTRICRSSASYLVAFLLLLVGDSRFPAADVKHIFTARNNGSKEATGTRLLANGRMAAQKSG